VDVEHDAGKGILKPLLNQRYGEVRDINAYPFAAKFLGCVDRRSTSAERIEDYITLIA
jgi:hypothetical protein